MAKLLNFFGWLGVRKCHGINRNGAGCYQHLRSRLYARAGRHNVIYQQNVPAGNRIWPLKPVCTS
jgi:hypothetical protein